MSNMNRAICADLHELQLHERANLAVAADARPFAGPAAEPPRFCATLRVAQPRAEGRARLNCSSVRPPQSRFRIG
jgi:hypothetical protein